MSLNLIKPGKKLKQFLKIKPHRDKIELFKENLSNLFNQINESESEEFHKNLIIKLLSATYYDPNYFINTKGRNDLVIHNGKDATTTVGVIIEAKKSSNKAEMLHKDNINTKAFHELLLYYLRERITLGNLEIKHLIATNTYEWFIFDAHLFEKEFAQNKKLVKQFKDFEEKRMSGEKTDFFYKEIAEPVIKAIKSEITFTHFDIRDYKKFLKKDDKKLIVLYKIFSPEHLLKLPFVNDSNSLDKSFYTELLHIIGLAEIKKGSKKLIERKTEKDRNAGSLLENAIQKIDSVDKIQRLKNKSLFGNNYDEQIFNVGLELSITWINRILFLKLLEAQIITYHKGDKEFLFFNLEKIKNFDDLDDLFFAVLAKLPDDRNKNVKENFANVPYLNSSLFEPTEIEQETIFISNLGDDKTLPIISSTVLKDSNGKKRKGELNALEYLFEFLNAYDFTSEGVEDIQEDNKTLINASVLGLIFEKINGYKDGSFFTPGFITMYMCRETIRRAVLQKFKDTKGWDCKNLIELHNKIENKKEANEIINSLKICDPAVGSGHFLVSALNEIIAIKSELDILLDRNGKSLKYYTIEVVNDELIVTDEDGELFEYHFNNKKKQRIQETLFHEKQTIIENCLFGVDINHNSVKICRLRLWIELLKNSYYKTPDFKELETLPNIDINIKCGNSLISRFPLDADIKKALKKSNWTIESYRDAVMNYRTAQNKEQKRKMVQLIADIKTDFRTEVAKQDPKRIKLNREKLKLDKLLTEIDLFELSKSKQKSNEKEQKLLEIKIKKLKADIEAIESSKIYDNAFEWRFEFPEVLNDDGDFIGFDLIIGNPPYIAIQKMKKEQSSFESQSYETYERTGDIYALFYEKGIKLLKQKGNLCYITSNKWMRTAYGKSLRVFFLTQNPILLIDCGPGVFENATVDVNIMFLQKCKGDAPLYGVKLKPKLANYNIVEYISSNQNPLINLNEQAWFIGSANEQKLKEKVERIGKPLQEWNVRINFGIKTGLNKAFIIDTPTKDQLCQDDPKSIEILKPILRGRDVLKFGYRWNELWIIASGYDIDVSNQYPAVFTHLKQLETRARARNDQGLNWWNLRSCTYYPEFEKEKLVWKRIGSVLRFGYDDNGVYSQDSTCIMTGKHLKYLCAVMNSTLGNSMLFDKAPKTGTGDVIVSVQALDPFLVPPITTNNSSTVQRIESLVDKILALKKENSNADISVLENKIDRLVYKLYDLTDEEIEIIENS